MKIVWGRSIGFNLELNKMEYTIINDGAGCYPWTEFFVLWPRTTITGKRVFLERAFKRRVWVVWGTGFHMEPEVEYATLFEIIGDDNNEN